MPNDDQTPEGLTTLRLSRDDNRAMGKTPTERPAPSSYVATLAEQLPQAAPEPNGLNFVSLFCGCGGLDLGFRSVGFELAGASDLEREATNNHKRNLGTDPTVCDVTEIEASDLPVSIDVLGGWFPLLTFQKVRSKVVPSDDTAGNIFFELTRVVEEVTPRYLVFETTPELLTALKGSTAKCVAAALLRLGYRLLMEKVDFAAFGVPQVVERLFVVGVRKNEWRGGFVFPKPTHRLPGNRSAAAWLEQAISQRDAIADLPSPTVEEYPLIEEAMRGHGNRVPMLRSADQAISTPSLAGFRRMTIRECARLASFPDWFEFGGDLSSSYGQVLDAVPPLVARALAQSVAAYDKRPKV